MFDICVHFEYLFFMTASLLAYLFVEIIFSFSSLSFFSSFFFFFYFCVWHFKTIFFNSFFNHIGATCFSRPFVSGDKPQMGCIMTVLYPDN